MINNITVFEKCSGRLWTTASTKHKIYLYTTEKNSKHTINHWWLFRDQFKELLLNGDLIKVKFIGVKIN